MLLHHTTLTIIIIESIMTWSENPEPRDITTPHLLPEVAIDVT
jgi:hypothetical protein